MYLRILVRLPEAGHCAQRSLLTEGASMAAKASNRQKRDPSPWCSRMRTTGKDRKLWTINRSLRTIASRARHCQASNVSVSPQTARAGAGVNSRGRTFQAGGLAPVTRWSLRHQRRWRHNHVGAQWQLPVLSFLVDALLGARFPVPHCQQHFRRRSQEFAKSQFRFV